MARNNPVRILIDLLLHAVIVLAKLGQFELVDLLDLAVVAGGVPGLPPAGGEDVLIPVIPKQFSLFVIKVNIKFRHLTRI